MNAVITCTSGSCKAYPSGRVLTAGQSETVAVGTAGQLPSGGGEAAGDAIEDAANAPGVGCNGYESGTASIRADGGALNARKYLPVNPFMNPDGADYGDEYLFDGDSIETDMIQENAKTLVVLGAA